MIKYLPYGVCALRSTERYECEGANVSNKKKKKMEAELAPEVAAEKRRRDRRRRRRAVGRVIDRIFGFFLATGIVLGCAGLALEYILLKGPSPALRDTFTMTMLETRRFTWTPRIFLTKDEVKSIKSRMRQRVTEEFDASLITIAEPTVEESDDGKPKPDAYGIIDEDGDGVVLETVKGNGFTGYMLIIYDPKRVYVGKPDEYGGSGLYLSEMVAKYGATGGINGGGFSDDNGAGSGGNPRGMVISEGMYYNYDNDGGDFAGFDADGILHVGYYTRSDAAALGIVNGVSFGPILVINGNTYPEQLSNGINPATAIGQRADGAVLMLVIDGRQVHSFGATWLDVANVMLSYGAVNAYNLDGGSSTAMWYNGGYVNKPSSAGGLGRVMPTAWLFN